MSDRWTSQSIAKYLGYLVLCSLFVLCIQQTNNTKGDQNYLYFQVVVEPVRHEKFNNANENETYGIEDKHPTKQVYSFVGSLWREGVKGGHGRWFVALPQYVSLGPFARSLHVF